MEKLNPAAHDTPSTMDELYANVQQRRLLAEHIAADIARIVNSYAMYSRADILELLFYGPNPLDDPLKLDYSHDNDDQFYDEKLIISEDGSLLYAKAPTFCLKNVTRFEYWLDGESHMTAKDVVESIDSRQQESWIVYFKPTPREQLTIALNNYGQQPAMRR